MSFETFAYIVGGLSAFFTIWAGAGTAMIISLVQRISKMEIQLAILGLNALKASHSPTDHLRLDYLVEKYEKNFELEIKEWVELEAICNETLKDPSFTPGDRLTCGQIHALIDTLKDSVRMNKALALHKQMRKSV